ncbi:MAG: DUF4270 domain-containing protein [Muribaculaceae bacterium]|nr:DUF4270 domain-containing protein [Muribaculaceae bacterium]
MKASRLFLPLSALTIAALNIACDEDSSQIGNSLTEGNVSIYVDSLTYDLHAQGVVNDNFDSRSGYLLLGSINVPQYGQLTSSFISRLMCVTDIGIPSEVDVSMIDSCQLLLNMVRGDIVGDSLAPQVVKVYKLNQQIPEGVTNKFNPVEEIGYQNMELMGSNSFTASGMGNTDSLFNSQKNLRISVDLGKEYAQKVFLEYKNNPQVFKWPQTFAQEFLPGIFVETSFGRGCISNIQAVYLAIFYHTIKEKTETVDGQEVVTKEEVPAIVYPFALSPEVLSSNNISYSVAPSLKEKVESGEIIITTPGGYNAKFSFPAQEIISRYEQDEHNLSLISDLSLTIPAEAVENNYGLTAAPNLLLVKTTEAADFFIKNKLPDQKTSFTATFDSDKNQYTFPSMRSYLLDLLAKGTITEEDTDFSIIPVYLTKEEQKDYNGNIVTYNTKCSPYTMRPTMTRLHTEKALVVFSFSSQKFD